MNKFEILAKLIVPAFFLIVWALNQIFNKETPATPARGNRPVGPPGGRPPVPPPPPKRSEEDRAFATADPKSGAWTSPSDNRGNNRPVVLAGDDEVIILSSESVKRPPPAKARTQSSPPANRPRQGRRSKGGEGEKEPQRLGGNISQSVRQTISQTPLDMKSITQSQPLTSLAADMRGPQGSSSMLSSTASTAGSSGPLAEVFDLKGALRSRARLREAFLLNELIQPPLALRGRETRTSTSPLHR